MIFRLNVLDEIGAWFVAKEIRTDDANLGRATVLDAAAAYPGEYVMLERFEIDERRMAHTRTKVVKTVVPA